MARKAFSKIVLSIFVLFSATSVHAAQLPKKVDVVIVGAGLSGLATAYELKKQKVNYKILEITGRVGGRVRTMHYDWQGEKLSADSGMEEYWESNPAVKVLKELKLPVTSDVAISSIMMDGKLEALGDEDRPEFLKRVMTQEGFSSFQKLEEIAKPILKEIHSGDISPTNMKLKDQSFSEWMQSLGLHPKTLQWVRITVECEIGTEWDKISALDGIHELKIFLGEGEKCYRVTGGNEKFTEALARSVGRHNIQLNQRVTRIVSKDNEVWVYYTDASASVSRILRASHVVVTVPLFRLFEMQFEPELSAKKKEAIGSQTWGAYFKAHVFVSKEASKHWTVKGESVLPILSDSELGVIYDGNPDYEGKTKILSLLITGMSADEFNLTPLDDVRKRITAGLEKLWPGIATSVQGIEFHRYHPRAIAAWPVGRSRYDEGSQEIRKPEFRVHLAGDFTETSHSDGAFISAERVTKNIVADLKAAKAKKK